MKKHFWIAVLLIILAIIIFQFDAEAQCAMCKASAESDLKEGKGVAKGINKGIIYIMFVPYIILIFAFRKKLKNFLKQFFAMWQSN